MLQRLCLKFSSLFMVAGLVLGLTAVFGVVANAQSEDYLAEVKAGVSWLNLDTIFGTQPATTPDTGGRPYLALEKREVTTCPGEPLSNCVRVVREKDRQNRILTFWGRNPTNCVQDGYSLDPVTGKMRTGVPALYEGVMEGFTYRNCSATESYGVSTSTAAVSAASVPDMSAETTDFITETVDVSNTVSYRAVVTADPKLRVRSAPATGDNLVGYVEMNQVVTVTEHSADGLWAKIGEGKWVARTYLKVEDTNSVAAASATVTATIAASATPVPTIAPTRQVTATAVATAAPTVAPTIAATPVAQPTVAAPAQEASTGPKSVKVISGVDKWVRCGTAWCWNTYKDSSPSDATPAVLTTLCPMDGEYMKNGVATIGIPAGENLQVNGITAPDQCQ